MINFPGAVVAFAGRFLLVYGPDADALGPARFGPPACLRPAYWCVPDQAYLLPEAAIDDIGQRFEGPECYAWIEGRGDAFPRADVLGTLVSGARRSVFMKELDLADLAVYAQPPAGEPVRIALAVEARAVPDGYALTPIPCPPELAPFSRALPCYRLAPGTFGAPAAALLTQLLASGRGDWQVTFDGLDDALGE